MPRGPKGEKRPADMIGNAVKVMRIATGEEEEKLPDPDKDYARKGGLNRTLPSFERKPLIWLALVGAVCLPDGGNAEQIEGVALGPGGGGENGDEAIAPEADDIAGERGEVAEQGMEAVHREGFALCRLGAVAGGLAARGW